MDGVLPAGTTSLTPFDENVEPPLVTLTVTIMDWLDFPEYECRPMTRKQLPEDRPSASQRREFEAKRTGAPLLVPSPQLTVAPRALGAVSGGHGSLKTARV
jgi:hypothetical protein